jgi:hypothetical protein
VEVGYVSALRNAAGEGEVPVFTKSEASALVYHGRMRRISRRSPEVYT